MVNCKPFQNMKIPNVEDYRDKSYADYFDWEGYARAIEKYAYWARSQLTIAKILSIIFIILVSILIFSSCITSTCNYQTVKLQESGYGKIHDYQKKGIRAQK